MWLSTDYSYPYVLLTPSKKSTKFTKPGSKTFVNTLLLYLSRCLLILLLQLNVFTKFGVNQGPFTTTKSTKAFSARKENYWGSVTSLKY